MADDIYTFFNSLSPEEQQQFAMNFGDQGQQEQAYFADVPNELGGANAFTQDPTSMLLGLLAGSGATPQLTTKGAVDPVDLTQLSQRLNYTQDLGGSMFDVAQALFAGPDAFGNPEQFAPITRYSGQAVPASQGADGSPTPITKSSMLLDDAIRMGGYRGFLAEAIKGGTDPDTAVAAMRDIVKNSANATNLDKATQEKVKSIRNTLGVWRTNDPLTGAVAPIDRTTAPWESFDEEEARKVAQGFYDQRLTDTMAASTLQYDPESGQFYPNKVTEDSPAAKKFRDAGLPLPGESYTDPARLASMNEAIDPNYQLNAQGYQSATQGRNNELEALSQKNLANQLDLQSWDEKLRGMSTPGVSGSRPALPPQLGPARGGGGPQGMRAAPTGGVPNGPWTGAALPPGFSAQTQPGAPQMGQRPLAVQPPGGGLPPGFSAQTQAGAPTMGQVPNGPWTGVGLPPGFSAQTQPGAASLQGVNPAGQPQIAQQRSVLDSFGRPRTTTDETFNFDLANAIFGNIPETGKAGVKKDQRLQNRNAPAQRKQNQADEQKWRDLYNKNYAATHNRRSTAAESNADYMAGQLRGRAMVSNPLQDTLLARLTSLRNRAGL